MSCCQKISILKCCFRTQRCVNLSYQVAATTSCCCTPTPNVILLRGVGYSSKYWRCLLAKLLPVANVYILDYIGTGDSQVVCCDSAYCLDAITRDVSDFVDGLCLGKVYLVGQGLGAMIALNFAAQFACKTCKVVVSGATPRFWPGDNWDGSTCCDVLALQEKILSAIEPDAIFRYTQSLVEAVDPICCPVRARLVSQYITTLCETRLYAKYICTYDIRERLSCIQAPVLIISGSLDPVTPPAAARFLRQHIVCSSIMEVPNMGHNIPVFATSLYNEAVFNYFFVQCDPCCDYFDSICAAVICKTTYMPAICSPPCAPPCAPPCPPPCAPSCTSKNRIHIPPRST